MSEANQRFLEYYNECKDKILNYLVYRLNFDRALAEDLFMDVVLKAYQNFDTFDPEKGSFKTWIFALAHNHLVNFWRDRQKKESLSLEQLEEEGHVAATTEMEDTLSPAFEGERVRHVLSLVSEAEREVITLRYLEELDYAEISQITGKKEGAIRTSLSRALDRFSVLYRKLYSAPKKPNPPKNL